MKTKMILALAASAVLLSGTAFAFHDGGVAECAGCHSMHNSADNPIGIDHDGNPTGATPNQQLLKGTDASSTCLNCHGRNGSYGILSTDGASDLTSGGDFWWVTSAGAYFETNYAGVLQATTVDPDNHGHNVVAADYGLTADGTNTDAPGNGGAAIDVNTFGCTSCHDPHGKVGGGTSDNVAIVASGSYNGTDPTTLPVGEILGNYRILGDSSFNNFTADAPVATASGSNGARVDYGSGMSEWCLNCHSNYAAGFGDTMHPTAITLNAGTVDIVANYNSYVKTGDFTGLVATAYDAMVPIERGTTDIMVLDETSTVGADANSQVMCLTCHRAHASAFDNALRWDNAETFLAESAVLINKAVVGGAFENTKPYYKNGAAVDMVATYGEYQRSLCNKCHVQD